jgi:hypothetical protein
VSTVEWLCVGDVDGSSWCMDVVVTVVWHFVRLMVDCLDVVMGEKYISMWLGTAGGGTWWGELCRRLGALGHVGRGMHPLAC